MHDTTLILTLTGGLTAALVLGYITQRLRLSPIVGYILAEPLERVRQRIAIHRLNAQADRCGIYCNGVNE